jgi:uncharacterized protein YyaL (SSP411 family)
MPNRLAQESSPYLLQHQSNPVDWHPWGAEALEKARREDKPIFLSIGYSACHWCHVMEHESFENEKIAAQLNANFVSIKVDREERPDLDQIYMNAVMMLTQRGGWPMSVFLTPDGRPFYGGTYWPPEDRMGMVGFPRVLSAVLDAWQNRREQLHEQAEMITSHLQEAGEAAVGSGKPLSLDTLLAAQVKLERAFDFTHGGFGTAPKFPHSMDLQVLLRLWKRTRRDGLLDMVRLNLGKMAAGGIYDHLAGGFARYSVDARWLVPHFEKMLYDNALLTTAYIEGFLATGDGEYARIARETLDYILNYMTDEAGGFHSTEDADSEGEEGKFYVWTPAEVKAVIGDEAGERSCYVYDVTREGNFEGHNILNLPKTIEQCARIKGWNVDELRRELAESREKLLKVRDQRVRPGKDDKILVSWNGLMIDAMARGHVVRNSARGQPGRDGVAAYTSAAIRAADFILTKMSRPDGRLLHSYRHGKAKLDAYLDDYACFANALVTLYEQTFDERWIDEAVRLAEIMLKRFKDPDGDGFFYTADDHEHLIARQKDVQDSSVPSGNAMAATCLLRLATLTGRDDFLTAAESCLRLGQGLMEQHATAAGQLLLALDFHLGPTPEIVILGDPADAGTAAVLNELRSHFLPHCVVACRCPKSTHKSPHLGQLFTGKELIGQSPTMFVCQDFACELPVSGQAKIIERIRSIAAH